jgi:transcription elongation factor Elf1
MAMLIDAKCLTNENCMRESLSTAHILKRSVLCGACNEAYLFTLDAIAHRSSLQCPACGNAIDLRAPTFRALLVEVTEVVRDLRSIETRADA